MNVRSSFNVRHLDRLLLGSAMTLAVNSLPAQTPNDRTFFEGEFVLVGGVEPDIESNLLRPLLLGAAQGRVYVFDFGDFAVKAFDWTGRMIWATGHFGKGPNEFVSPTDLRVAEDGSVWVVDPKNLRVTVITPDGAVSKLIPIRIQHRPREILPSNDGSFWLLLMDDELLAVRLNPDGEVVDEQPLPIELRDVVFTVRQPFVTGTESGSVAIGFAWSALWARWNVQQRQLDFFRGVEPVEFPEPIVRPMLDGGKFVGVDRNATFATRDVTAVGNTVYTLFAGAGPLLGRLVDTYSLQSGSYLGSYRLPERITDLALNDGHFIGLVSSPVPAIRVWQWNVGGSTERH